MSDLRDTFECYKIDSYYNYPGFVQIRALGKMNYNSKCKKYEFSHATSTRMYLEMDISVADDLVKERFGILSERVQGPGIKLQNTKGYPPQDSVLSVWCPQWHKEAQEWPKRRRDYGLPTTSTISEVVRNGCDVVYVQHRACTNDKLQWRLSFSVC